jgi:CubicO group peptidase (beta-lactamase class C family)
MSDQPRAFPGRPSLRYLKLEARRRLAAGEFATLHDAQLAIAREHGLSSWTVLKEHVESVAPPANPALAQLRWVLSRFTGADEPSWPAPGHAELAEHFTQQFLTAIPPARLAETLARRAADLREELVVGTELPLFVRGQVAGLQVEAAAEEEPPHRLRGLRFYPIGGRVSDPRVAAPSTRTSGEVPAAAAAAADEAFAELGLVGLAIAGAASDGAVWAAASGWAELDREEVLRTDHRFPACEITQLVTATAVLRLVADGRVGLDDPANDHLGAIRLADDAVTVRELLSYTAGVDDPAELFADRVPDLVALAGPVLACSGERGEFRPSQGGYAALGQLIADTVGSAYADAVTGLVLNPLGMAGSSFPAAWPDDDPDAVTGYALTGAGSYRRAARQVCVIPAAGGLWTTASDLVRFGRGWSALLPEALAREALRPQVSRGVAGVHVGLGWNLNDARGVAGHAGAAAGASSSLVVQVGDRRGQLSDCPVYVALTNRRIPVEPVNGRVIRAIG